MSRFTTNLALQIPAQGMADVPWDGMLGQTFDKLDTEVAARVRLNPLSPQGGFISITGTGYFGADVQASQNLVAGNNLTVAHDVAVHGFSKFDHTIGVGTVSGGDSILYTQQSDGFTPTVNQITLRAGGGRMLFDTDTDMQWRIGPSRGVEAQLNTTGFSTTHGIRAGGVGDATGQLDLNSPTGGRWIVNMVQSVLQPVANVPWARVAGDNNRGMAFNSGNVTDPLYFNLDNASHVIVGKGGGFLGVGQMAVPKAYLHVVGGSNQVLVDYGDYVSPGNVTVGRYLTIGVGSDGSAVIETNKTARPLGLNASVPGNLTIRSFGNIYFDPIATQDPASIPTVYPWYNHTINLGGPQAKWLSIWADELDVETLVARDVVSTIGGRIYVAATTTLTRELLDNDFVLVDDLSVLDTFGRPMKRKQCTVYLKHNDGRPGDFMMMEAHLHLEIFMIRSNPVKQAQFFVGTVSKGNDYAYTVWRDIDKTGPNHWDEGDAVMNTGSTGDGFHDIYAMHSIATRPLIYLYNYDAATNGWSTNLYDDTNFDLWNTIDAKLGTTFNKTSLNVNDAMYFGVPYKLWGNLYFMTKEYMHLISGTPRYAFEYWNGTTWAPFNVTVTPNQLAFQQIGWQSYEWDGTQLTNWVQTNLPGSPDAADPHQAPIMWVRLRVTSGANVSIWPHQTGQRVYWNRGQYGPTHAMLVRNSSNPDRWWEGVNARYVAGNLNGYFGYASNEYGVAMGLYDPKVPYKTYIRIDSNAGLRMSYLDNNSLEHTFGQWDAQPPGAITIGETGGSMNYLQIDTVNGFRTMLGGSPPLNTFQVDLFGRMWLGRRDAGWSYITAQPALLPAGGNNPDDGLVFWWNLGVGQLNKLTQMDIQGNIWVGAGKGGRIGVPYMLIANGTQAGLDGLMYFDSLGRNVAKWDIAGKLRLGAIGLQTHRIEQGYDIGVQFLYRNNQGNDQIMGQMRVDGTWVFYGGNTGQKIEWTGAQLNVFGKVNVLAPNGTPIPAAAIDFSNVNAQWAGGTYPGGPANSALTATNATLAANVSGSGGTTMSGVTLIDAAGRVTNGLDASGNLVGGIAGRWNRAQFLSIMDKSNIAIDDSSYLATGIRGASGNFITAAVIDQAQYRVYQGLDSQGSLISAINSGTQKLTAAEMVTAGLAVNPFDGTVRAIVRPQSPVGNPTGSGLAFGNDFLGFYSSTAGQWSVYMNAIQVPGGVAGKFYAGTGGIGVNDRFMMYDPISGLTVRGSFYAMSGNIEGLFRISKNGAFELGTGIHRLDGLGTFTGIRIGAVADSGGIGTGQFEVAGYENDVKQAYMTSDGRLYGNGGNMRLDNVGFRVTIPDNSQNYNSGRVYWSYQNATVALLDGFMTGGPNPSCGMYTTMNSDRSASDSRYEIRAYERYGGWTHFAMGATGFGAQSYLFSNGMLFQGFSIGHGGVPNASIHVRARGDNNLAAQWDSSLGTSYQSYNQIWTSGNQPYYLNFASGGPVYLASGGGGVGINGQNVISGNALSINGQVSIVGAPGRNPTLWMRHSNTTDFLGYEVSTSENGSWAWRFVDGTDFPFFTVGFPSGTLSTGGLNGHIFAKGVMSVNNTVMAPGDALTINGPTSILGSPANSPTLWMRKSNRTEYLGYQVRTNEVADSWSWRFVDGADTQYFRVDYPSGDVHLRPGNPTANSGIGGGLFVDGIIVAINNINTLADLHVSGTMFAAVKSFQIAHPNPKKASTEQLRHFSVEGPEPYTVYTWEVTTVAETPLLIPLDADWYPHLNRDSRVWIAPVEHFGRGWGRVDATGTHVEVHTDAPGRYNVMVTATRQDPAARALLQNWDGQLTRTV